MTGCGSLSNAGALLTIAVLASGACSDTSEPRIPVASVSVSPALDTLRSSATLQLTARLSDNSGSALTGDVLWASTDPDIASVSASGLVTARHPGSVTISATNGDQQGTATLVVIHPLQAVSVVAGGDLTCAIGAQGQVWCWGWNASGTAGLGTTLGGFVDQPLPVPVGAMGGTTFRSISISGNGSNGGPHACGITTAGAARCWGNNSDGQLGDSTRISRLEPTSLYGNPVLSQIGVGDSHSCGLGGSGALLCWGLNSVFQLGLSVYRTIVPVQVATFGRGSILAIAGDDSCVLDRGTPACWGDQTSGSPAPVTGAPVLASLTGGGLFASFCGLALDGAAWCWGQNGEGQLGNGTTGWVWAPPTAVLGGLHFASIQPGDWHTCAIATSGAAWCWGSNWSGELGNGDTVSTTAPVPVGGDLRFQSIAVGSNHTCAVSVDGEVYCWGYGPSLGINLASGRRYVPVPVSVP